MAVQSLAELDKSFSEAPHLRLVAETNLVAGGVDPLGLRQLNLNLMDAALPGINNVTSRVRPYTFMAWAWWKAAQLAEAEGRQSIDAAELQDLVDRLEVLFVWSHFLADDGAGLPGRRIISDRLPSRGSPREHSFSGSSWDSFRSSRRSSTALMAPIQYGPSIRSLGWLIPAQAWTFRASTESMPAIQELDARVVGALAPEMLRLGSATVSASAAETLHPAWAVHQPSEAERKAFRHLFYEVGREAPEESQPWRRRKTLDLVLRVLDQAGEKMSVPLIRSALASGRMASGEPLELDDALTATHHHWACLQARQLQRLALESLLRWVEVSIDNGISLSEDLAARADEAAQEEEDGADAPTVASYLSHAAGRATGNAWPGASGIKGNTDIFALMEDMAEAQREVGCARVPGLALRALAYADAITLALKDVGVGVGLYGPLGGQADRLPLWVASQRLRSAHGRSLRSLWAEIIEVWVIGQHVRWSIARNGDATQRLRVALGDRGWVRLWKDHSGPFGPTADRLWTAMALAAECGLVDRTTDDDYEIRYSALA